MTRTLRIVLAGAGLRCLMAPALAHHSFEVEYDPRKVADSIALADGRAFTGASGAPDAQRAQ